MILANILRTIENNKLEEKGDIQAHSILKNHSLYVPVPSVRHFDIKIFEQIYRSKGFGKTFLRFRCQRVPNFGTYINVNVGPLPIWVHMKA